VASAPILLAVAINATAAGESLLTGVEPLARLHQERDLASRAFAGDGEALAALRLAEPHWRAALASLEPALQALEQWDELPKGLIVAPRIDPYYQHAGPLLPAVREGLEMLADRPEVIDALVGLSHPRNYLVLLQNSWELRPTGGFITAAVVVTVAAGQIELSPFQDSYRVDLDYSALPPPPTTLRNALWGAVWTFRDANWSPDFPTSAKWAQDLYLIGRDQTIDGVVALNPIVVEYLLRAVGPLWVPDYETDVSAEDLWSKLAGFHGLPPGIEDAEDPARAAIEQRKAFLPAVAEPLLVRVRQGTGEPRALLGLSQAILDSLHERHLLLTLGDTAAAAWLAEQGWDGSLWAGESDYLQVVDSNVGFNKADARIQRTATYHVRLTDDGGARAELVIDYHNQSVAKESECVQELVVGGYDSDWIDACYWTYLRIYVPAGSRLIGVEPAEWPAGSLWRRANPGSSSPPVHVGRDPAGKEVFGVLVAVPPGERRTVRFDYALPPLTWTPGEGYRLYFQKQSGTIEMLVRVLVELPEGATIIGDSRGEAMGRQVTAEFELRTDAQLETRLQGETVERLAARPTSTPTVYPSATPVPTRTPTPVPTLGPSPTPLLLLITATPSPPAPTAVSSPATPVPEATSVPLDWARVQVPEVGIDSIIVSVGWQLVGPPEARYAEWEVAAYAAGHHRDSARPGEIGNVVLSGHHNILGEVFRDLWSLEAGDEILLTDSAGTLYRYVTREVNILPDAGMPPEVRASYLRYLQRTREPILTLVTCWPYESNTHRTIVVAELAP
jgi:LPXTG-site transpeptidase (sortase) family protein